MVSARGCERASVFRHVGTCVQLLSPLIFCLVSVLSGISA